MITHIWTSLWTASADLVWVWLSHQYDIAYCSRVVAWRLQHGLKSSLNVSALKDIANAWPNDFCHWFPMKVQLMCKNWHKDARCYDTVLLRSKSDNPQLWTIPSYSYSLSYTYPLLAILIPYWLLLLLLFLSSPISVSSLQILTLGDNAYPSKSVDRFCRLGVDLTTPTAWHLLPV